MKRKTLLLSSLVAVGALALVGCQPKEGGSSKVKVYVHTQYGHNPRGLLDTFAGEFNELQDKYEVIVDMEFSGDYNDLFDHEKQALQDPQSEGWGDLVGCYPDHVVDYMLDFRAAAKLDDYIAEFTEDDLADFTVAASDQFDIVFPRTGKFVLPFSTSTECMFYNPVVLTLQIPGVNNGERITKNYIDNLTWDEFFDVFCPKLLEYNEGLTNKIIATKDPLGADQDYGILGYRDDNNFFITLLEQYGYSYTSVDPDSHQASIDFNTPEVRNLMKKFNKARSDHYIVTDGAIGGQGIQGWLKSKQSLFYVASTGGIQYTQSAIDGAGWEIECGRLPQASNESGRQKMISQGGSWCILEHPGKNKEARVKGAFEFYKYITETKQCTRWAAETGYYPIRRSTTATNAWSKLIDEYDSDGEPKEGIQLLTARNAAYCEKYDNILYTSAVFKGSSAARSEVDGLMIKIMKRANSECTDDWLLTEFNTAYNNIHNQM